MNAKTAAGLVCVAPTGDWTGEGALWDADGNAVWWVDINRFLIHRLDAANGDVRTWFFAEPPTAIALTDRPGTFVVALASRVILWQPANDARSDFARPDIDHPRVRSNDARADPAGNFWLGTMQNNVAPNGSDIPITDDTLGRLYRIAPDGSWLTAKTGIGISNTVAWSPDGRRFYFADTLRNVISVWDYDAASGMIANERPFFSGFERGSPDGSAVDSAGYLWNARYGGACVVRLAPDGSIDRVIDVPVGAPTTCTFGGPDLKTLYITSAGGGSAMAKGEQLGGGLFAMPVDAPGLPENRVRLG